MTKSELNTMLKDKQFLHGDNVYYYNNAECTITVSGEHIIIITVLVFDNAVSHFIPLKHLTVEKFEKIIKVLKEKLKELNKEL